LVSVRIYFLATNIILLNLTPLAVSFQRRVLKGITLSNGQYIPPGVIIHVPTEAIHTDSAHFSDGSTFDGFRHLKLRQGGTASDHARNQLVSANELSLGFGYGSHACPGRFFAVNEMKMIVARLLLDYDIKMPGDATERWPQLYIGGSGMPDPGKTIMLKRREV
jgi:cytochrome P450